MKKTLISAVLLISMLLCCAGCVSGGNGELTGTEQTKEETDLYSESTVPASQAEAAATSEAVTGEVTAAPDDQLKKQSYSILFIGNSYTQRNELPTTLFAAVAKSAGYTGVKVEMVIKGGETLANHASSVSETGAVIDKKLAQTKYDYVVIQEQSDLPASEPGAFFDGARALCEKIAANGAKPVMYETWGKKEGHANLGTFKWTSEEMTWRIAASYSAIGKELNAVVAYTGLAFRDVLVNSPSIELYDPDLSHPSYAGSYLAAMTIFAQIFNVDPVGISYNGSVPAETATVLKQAAHNAVFKTPEIPSSYIISSENVHKAVQPDTIDTSKTKNLTEMPKTPMISILTGGTYSGGRSFSGILGTKGKTASAETSPTGLTAAQKADIADIGYGVSVIGIEKMNADYPTAVENLVNGHWGSSMMASFTFDDLMYNISGQAEDNGRYRCLFTLNFGEIKTFNALGFISGNLKGFPGAVEVFVSDNGVDWTIVPTACWDRVNGAELVDLGASPADPWS